jgi:CubicO group peptidase (beta-lactamase class C family)
VVGDLDRARVTLRHLLAHASGLPGYARLFETERTPEALLHACLSMPLQHPPGVHSEYSDLGFILLGKALETISGESIDTFCRREVFTICGMDNTCFLPDASLRPHIPPTEKDMTFRHRVIQGEVQDENCFVLGGVSGHAGLFGNALDVLRFAAALLDSADGAHKNSLFQRETVSLFSARVALPPGSSRALGWDTPSASSYSETSSSGTLFSAHSIGHLGYAGTSLWIDLDARIAITLLSNRTWPDRQNQAIRTLRPRFHDMICTALQSH